MVMLVIMQAVTRLVRFGKDVRETWHEAQQLRRSLGGPTEE